MSVLGETIDGALTTIRGQKDAGEVTFVARTSEVEFAKSDGWQPKMSTTVDKESDAVRHRVVPGLDPLPMEAERFFQK